jgi:hypothetical protein
LLKHKRKNNPKTNKTMASRTETGHSKNVANFNHLIAAITTFGTNYAPPRTDLSIVSLTTAAAGNDTILQNVNNAFVAWKNSTNAREIPFEALGKFSTQLLGIFESCNVTQQAIDDFISLNNKLQGNSSSSTTPTITKAASTISATPIIPAKHISTSQQSFDRKLDHFDKIVKLLTATPTYTPTETQFKVTTLTAQVATLTTLNTNAVKSYETLTINRTTRNHAFYDEPNGLFFIAKAIKKYVKGHFKANSPEHKQVTKFKFVRIVAKKK